ncbi:hypothetical protein O6H91_Y538900 [Diphasiastrum complanatum]|nr:hypothetical protein O6H91_Y538900 [Diphasiastrum complanatum]KAJ7184032.1 hypothetical protein O6H91_Y538900 [Diphasiastrum complanatum]
MADLKSQANSTHTLRHRPAPAAPSPSPSHQHHPPQQKQHLAAAAPACIGLVGALVLVAIVVRFSSPSPKLWTKEELSKHNGSDDSLPIFLSILGSVFDVTLGRQHYGLNGRYNYFAGRDATRGFITGQSTGTFLCIDSMDIFVHYETCGGKFITKMMVRPSQFKAFQFCR